jgi:hypothetical protein
MYTSTTTFTFGTRRNRSAKGELEEMQVSVHYNYIHIPQTIGQVVSKPGQYSTLILPSSPECDVQNHDYSWHTASLGIKSIQYSVCSLINY